MRWLVVAALLAGCDQVLRLDDIKPPPDAPPCVMPDISDDFTAQTPVCGDWGKVQGNAAWLSRSGDALVITTDSTASYASCKTLTEFTFGPYGVFVELSEVETNNGFGIFQLSSYSSLTDANPNAETQFTVQAAFVGFLDQTTCAAGKCVYIASGGYVASQMRWLRMIPTNGGATITAQISPDGFTWTEYGHRDLPPPAIAAYVVAYLGGGNNGPGSAGRTVYQHFDVCPR